MWEVTRRGFGCPEAQGFFPESHSQESPWGALGSRESLLGGSGRTEAHTWGAGRLREGSEVHGEAKGEL